MDFRVNEGAEGQLRKCRGYGALESAHCGAQLGFTQCHSKKRNVVPEGRAMAKF